MCILHMIQAVDPLDRAPARFATESSTQTCCGLSSLLGWFSTRPELMPQCMDEEQSSQQQCVIEPSTCRISSQALRLRQQPQQHSAYGKMFAEGGRVG